MPTTRRRRKVVDRKSPAKAESLYNEPAYVVPIPPRDRGASPSGSVIERDTFELPWGDTEVIVTRDKDRVLIPYDKVPAEARINVVKQNREMVHYVWSWMNDRVVGLIYVFADDGECVVSDTCGICVHHFVTCECENGVSPVRYLQYTINLHERRASGQGMPEHSSDRAAVLESPVEQLDRQTAAPKRERRTAIGTGPTRKRRATTTTAGAKAARQTAVVEPDDEDDELDDDIDLGTVDAGAADVAESMFNAPIKRRRKTNFKRR